MYVHVHDLPRDLTLLKVTRLWDGFNNCVIATNPDVYDEHEYFTGQAERGIALDWDANNSGSCLTEDSRLHWKLEIVTIDPNDPSVVTTSGYMEIYSVSGLTHTISYCDPDSDPAVGFRCDTRESAIPVNDPNSWQNVYVLPKSDAGTSPVPSGSPAPSDSPDLSISPMAATRSRTVGLAPLGSPHIQDRICHVDCLEIVPHASITGGGPNTMVLLRTSTKESS